MYAKWFFVVALLAMSVTAEQSFAIVTDSSVDPTLQVNYGALPEFDSVGFMTAQNVSSSGSVRGSGVLINNPYDDKHSWVLGVGHLAQEVTSGLLREDITFDIGTDNFEEPNLSFDVVETYVHPDFNQIAFSPDLALYKLDGKVPESVARPATIYTGGVSVGQDVSHLGFGRTGTEQGFTETDGLLRGTVNEIDQFGFSSGPIPDYYLLTQFIPADFIAGNPLSGIVGPGDSGGGTFLDVEAMLEEMAQQAALEEMELAMLTDIQLGVAEEMQLVGINSFFIGSPDHFGFSGAVDLSRFHDSWIEPTLRLGAVPEPASAALVGIVILPFTLIRRRRMT